MVPWASARDCVLHQYSHSQVANNFDHVFIQEPTTHRHFFSLLFLEFCILFHSWQKQVCPSQKIGTVSGFVVSYVDYTAWVCQASFLVLGSISTSHFMEQLSC